MNQEKSAEKTKGEKNFSQVSFLYAIIAIIYVINIFNSIIFSLFATLLHGALVSKCKKYPVCIKHDCSKKLFFIKWFWEKQKTICLKLGETKMVHKRNYYVQI